MKEQLIPIKGVGMKKIPVILVIGLLVLAAGCAGALMQKYGSLQMDNSVEHAFIAGAMKPNLTYYYLASEEAPYVIIGVDKKLVLDDAESWNLMVPQISSHLQRVVKTSYDRWREQGFIFRGFRMLDQDGLYIGDWYSVWDITIVNPVLFSRDGHVVIYPPPFPRMEPSGPGKEVDHR